jgi:N-formylmaleamate deformylase
MGAGRVAARACAVATGLPEHKEATMLAWKSGEVEANGLRLRYYRTGVDGPPVVLAHGITDSGLCWPLVAAALADEYRVITYDARGHGRSESARGPYTRADQADDLAELVKALGLVRPTLIGHSMGADTTATAAARHPDLASAIVLEDPPWRDEAPAAPQPLESYRERLRAYCSMTRDGLIAYGKGRNPNWHDAEWEPWADAKLAVSPAMIDCLQWSPSPWREDCPKITCPTLLVIAEAGDRPDGLGGIVTEAVAAEALALMPRAQVARITGAGHNIRREAFEDYIAAVRTFLRCV